MFPEAGRATVEVLERLGHEVVFPQEQTCCGQMHANSGYRDEALALARRFVHVFGDYDLIVSPSSSCVGQVREVYPELARAAGDAELETATRAIAPRVFALSPPLELLRNVKGLELVELERADECCGFGGTFALKNAETSSAMLADKCADLLASGAEVCVALDASCLLQIGGGLSRLDGGPRTMHLAEVLAST